MDFPLRVLPGDGIVVRSDHFVGVAPGNFDTEAAARVEKIFGSYGESESWAHLVRTIATSIIEANFTDHPPVVAALIEPTAVRVFVYGDVTLRLSFADGSTHDLDGATTSTWVDQQIAGELVQMSAGDHDALGSDLSGARGSLVAGIVPGAGLAISAASVVPKAVSIATAPSLGVVSPGVVPPPPTPAAHDSEATIEPTQPDNVADAASTLLSKAPESASVAPSPQLDQEFKPDVTATIGPNELAEIRAAVAAHPNNATAPPAPVVPSPPPPSPLPPSPPPASPLPAAAPLADLPPPPRPAAEPEVGEPEVRETEVGEPEAGEPVGQPTEIDLRHLPPPPADDDRRTPAAPTDTLSVERSPYAPPANEVAAEPVEATPAQGAPVKRRGIFAAVPDPREAKAVAGGAVTVTGVRCPQGHLNRMQSSSCALCGSPVDPSSAIEQGERPALGQLRFDDGQLYPLDRPYVLGRRPESSAPGIGIIVIDDERHMVSKRHAEIRIVGWDVKIVDLGSSNGTKVFPPGGSPQQAIRLRPNVEVVLAPGSHIQIGERTFQYLTEGSQ